MTTPGHGRQDSEHHRSEPSGPGTSVPGGRRPRGPRPPGVRGRTVLRTLALAAWSLVLIAFWLGARRADAGPLDYLLSIVEQAASGPWAPAFVLGLYLLRPVLLVPITVANLASGFVLGALPGVLLAFVGTYVSSTVGYHIGKSMGSAELADDLSERWPFVRMLRRRSFESVVAGGLMYLHADMVNLPAGLLRIRFATFLLGITLGNALTLTTAVLTGASVDGDLASASIRVDASYLVPAAVLLAVSFALAYWLRRRLRPLD